MTALSVNVNKIALLRNTRDIGIPSVRRMAEICVQAGAHGITVHPRPDQRHILPSDVYELAAMLAVEFNIEGNPFAGPTDQGYPGFMELVRQVKPTQCTLVPDSPEQKTSDHGWDLAKDGRRLAPLVRGLKDLGIRVSLFIDAGTKELPRVREMGADRIELYTEPYARAFAAGKAQAALLAFADSAKAAQDLGLGVNAGHDLNLGNLTLFCTIPGILEVSIGHALIAEALEMGLSATVRKYLEILGEKE